MTFLFIAWINCYKNLLCSLLAQVAVATFKKVRSWCGADHCQPEGWFPCLDIEREDAHGPAATDLACKCQLPNQPPAEQDQEDVQDPEPIWVHDAQKTDCSSSCLSSLVVRHLPLARRCRLCLLLLRKTVMPASWIWPSLVLAIPIYTQEDSRESSQSSGSE